MDKNIHVNKNVNKKEYVNVIIFKKKEQSLIETIMYINMIIYNKKKKEMNVT